MGIKKGHLAPFMLVAGDHATNDLCSDEEGSWKHFFTEKASSGNTLIGPWGIPKYQELYVQHLNKSFNRRPSWQIFYGIGIGPGDRSSSMLKAKEYPEQIRYLVYARSQTCGAKSVF